MTTAVPSQRAPSRERIKVLLLENIHESAHQMFAAEHFSLEALTTALPEAELAGSACKTCTCSASAARLKVTAAALAEARRAS